MANKKDNKNYKDSITIDRILQVKKEMKLKGYELADRAGLTRSVLSRYLTGKFEPKLENVIKIAEALDVNASWLLGYTDTRTKFAFSTMVFEDNGNKQLALLDVEKTIKDGKVLDNMLSTLEDENQTFNTVYNNYYYKSYINNLSAGSFGELIENTSDELVPIPIEFKKYDKNNRMHLFKVNGTSMNRVIPDGSIVVAVDNDNNGFTYKDGTIVVVFYQNEATVKRIVDQGDFVFLVPDSTDNKHQPIYIEKNLIDDFYIVGKVIYHINPINMEKVYNKKTKK